MTKPLNTNAHSNDQTKSFFLIKKNQQYFFPNTHVCNSGGYFSINNNYFLKIFLNNEYHTL